MCLRDLLAPPTDHRPGVDDSVSRFHRCKTLDLSGTDITDQALEYIAMWLPHLQILTISFCVQLTSKGLEFLVPCENIEQLNMDCCYGVNSVDPVAQMPAIKRVHVGEKNVQLAKKFVELHSNKFKFEETGNIVRKTEN